MTSRARRLALVTGASRGIGRATALALARRGLDLALVGRASPQLHEARDEVRATGVVTGECFECDVADDASVISMKEAVLMTLGVPDVIVNNAGIVRRGALVEDTSVRDWDDVIAVNLRGPFLIARAFLPAMRAANRGRFVHVASVSSTVGCPRNASYAASKWGLLGFAKSLAEELRGSALVSVAVLPGSVDTDMLRGSGFEPSMSASDVAETIVHLALDAPAAMHGSAVEMFG